MLEEMLKRNGGVLEFDSARFSFSDSKKDDSEFFAQLAELIERGNAIAVTLVRYQVMLPACQIICLVLRSHELFDQVMAESEAGKLWFDILRNRKGRPCE